MRDVLLAVVLFLVWAAGAPGMAGAATDEVDLRGKLDQIRADPALASDPAAIDALVRDADRAEDAARVEAWALAGEAYANRLGRPDDAARLWEKILADPSADPILARKAARDLLTYHLARGDAASARRVAGTDRDLLSDVVRFERRRAGRWIAIASIASLVLLAGVTALRAGRRVLGPARRVLRFAIAYGVYVAAAGALLASGYEGGNARPFLFLGAALPPLLLLARAWAAGGSRTTAARAGRAAIAAAGVLGAAFLVLENVDATYLEGFGL